ncbi:MAG: hypothetical protein ACOZB3_07675 [Calditrichota bacterium]
MTSEKLKYLCCGIGLALMLLIAGCKELEETLPIPPQRTRVEAIPEDAVKYTPEMDLFPPVLHTDDWAAPVPLSGPVNTAGAEDAPVITYDGNTFFFFFTPDVRVPPERQIIDYVTGIYWTRFQDNHWTEPERMMLCDDIALDGPMSVIGDTLWFASFRVGNYRDDGDIYWVEWHGQRWENWQNAGEVLNGDYNIGEMCISPNDSTLYFDRSGTDGLGGQDLWMTERAGGSWTEPVNLGAPVNTASDESRPCLSANGRELYYTGTSRMGYTGPALFRTVMSDSGWSDPEEIISNFAGDPAMDAAGNIYFTHHFFDSSFAMIEADIYVAYRR